MAFVIPITGARKEDCLSVKYEDVFNLKELYKFCHDILVSKGYASEKRDEYMERFYLERLSQKGDKEIWVWWRTNRAPGGSIYFLYVLNLDFHVLSMRDVELMLKGRKLKAHKGEVEILINGYIELMPGYEPKGWMSVFAEFFRRYIYRAQIEAHKRTFRAEIDEIQDAIKRFLELKGFLPETELFVPPKGLI